ncbi:hypothetical protein NBRC10512v2_003799 [Rhodotorula toruloides]
MVYYVCPNCGNRTAEYSESMVHYNACDVVRVRTVNSPPGSTVGFSAGAGKEGQQTGGGTGGGTGSSEASSAGSVTPANREGEAKKE